MNEAINKNLQREINRDVMIHKATKVAQVNHVNRNAAARRNIEKLNEMAQLEQDYINDFEYD